MLRLTTKVTTSPTTSRRRSSAMRDTRHVVPQRVPAAVGRVEVPTAIFTTTVTVDRPMQVDPACRSPAAVGLLPGPSNRGHVPGQPGDRVGQCGHVPGEPRVEPGFGLVRRVDRQPLAQLVTS